MILKLKRINLDAYYDLASKRLRSMWRLDSAGSASSYMTCTVRLIITTVSRLDYTLRIGEILLLTTSPGDGINNTGTYACINVRQ